MVAQNSKIITPSLPKTLPGFESINRFWDRTREISTAKILPGEFYVTARNEAVVTVLGSCVSACIRDPVFGVGGMNHFMLPKNAPNGGWDKDGGISTRYGNVAMEQLINEILKNGGARKNLEVKIFGGGRILSQMTDIGLKNINFVRAFIKTEGLKLVSEDVGDICPRKVHYYPRSGKVLVKKLRSLHNDTVSAREQAYLRNLEAKPVDGEIDLF